MNPPIRLYMTMSLDGFITGPDDRKGQELGRDGGRLFNWLDDRLSDGPSGQVFREAMATGAVISGRRTFELAGRWQGVPWASPVWYAHAGYREFFWASDPQARHSGNIEIRPRVSIVIFDSSARPGTAPAVYLSGTAAMVTGPGLDSGIEVYSRRSQEQGLPAWAPSGVQAPARHRLYRAIAAELSVLRPGGVDVRIPVALDSVAALAPEP